MTPFSAWTLLPLLSVTLAVGFTSMRLGRRAGVALQILCVIQAGWVAALILLDSGAVAWAERLLPAGMLLAGAFVQAARELAPKRLSRRVVVFAWTAAALVALIGLVAPRALYGPGARGMGPLFIPLALASTVGTLATMRLLLSLAREQVPPRERRRRTALLLANMFGALGGGGAIALHITDLLPIGFGAPWLLASVVTAAYAVWSSEDVRGRELLRQGAVETSVTAVMAALLVLALFFVVPRLVPSGDVFSPTGAVITLLLLIPLEPLRRLVTDRVLGVVFRAPIAVRELTSALEAEQTRAEHAERLAELGRVASAVAHEIRNPLGVILAETRLLEREGASAEGTHAIRAQVGRASHFVEDLLRYARPRPLEFVELDLGAAVQKAATEAARTLDGAEARLVLPQDVRAVIEADRFGLEDVVRNLVSNALIATVGVPSGRVWLEIAEEPAHVCIRVEDNGPGVPPEIASRLFQPFVTGRGRDERHPGTGLGLAISARLAERHGASLSYERSSSGGARFVARWPRRPSATGEKR